jgi:hypothetical protein
MVKDIHSGLEMKRRFKPLHQIDEENRMFREAAASQLERQALTLPQHQNLYGMDLES